MADQIEINIYLKGEGGNVAVKDNATGSGSDINGMSQASNTQAGNTATGSVDLKPLKQYVASQTIDVFIANTKSVISQNIGIITGKNELQQRVNFGMTVVQQGVNTYKNAAQGATIASALGMSTGVGAAIGVALTAINYGIDLAFRQNQLNLQRILEDNQIKQATSKLGAGYNKSREGI